jgi:hypothetical protein
VIRSRRIILVPFSRGPNRRGAKNPRGDYAILAGVPGSKIAAANDREAI